MLLKPQLPYWVFPLLESTFSLLVPHTESFFRQTLLSFVLQAWICVNSTARGFCMFIWSNSSQLALSLKNRRGGGTLVWINCHLGLVTLNVMYYQSYNDNKWSQHTRGQAYSQSIQTHFRSCQTSKCFGPSPQVLSDLHLTYWSGQLLLHGLVPEEKKEHPTRFLLHRHSSAAPLPIKGMIKSDKVSGKWRESRQRPQPCTLVNYCRDSKGTGGGSDHSNKQLHHIGLETKQMKE